MLNIVNKLFGSLGSKNLKTYDKIVKKINDFEIEISELDDQELKNKTQFFKKQLEEKEKTINEILPEAFAVVREASKRTLKMRHFDVQLIGGIVLHEGKIVKSGDKKLAHQLEEKGYDWIK